MQKWEYLFIAAREEGDGSQLRENWEDLIDWKEGPPLYEYVSYLGEQGWELVSSDFSDRHFAYRFAFKRPKL